MVEGGAETSALTDAEINAVLEMFPGKWKRAKLALLESLCRRFAYEPDTKTGPLSFSFAERAKIWREDYEKLKKEVQNGSAVIPRYGIGTDGSKRPPYFHVGMMENGEAKAE